MEEGGGDAGVEPALEARVGGERPELVGDRVRVDERPRAGLGPHPERAVARECEGAPAGGSEVRGGGRAFLAADLAVESKDAAVRGDQHGLSSTIVLGGGRRKGRGAGAREAAEEAPHLLGGVYASGGSAVRGGGRVRQEIA